jgi:hypothetical protein
MSRPAVRLGRKALVVYHAPRRKLRLRNTPPSIEVKITPTPVTAALAGAFSAFVMPALWTRLADETTWLVLAFLLVVALPAHALVVGMGRRQTGAAVDVPLLKRISAWLAAAAVALIVAQAVRT